MSSICEFSFFFSFLLPTPDPPAQGGKGKERAKDKAILTDSFFENFRVFTDAGASKHDANKDEDEEDGEDGVDVEMQ